MKTVNIRQVAKEAGTSIASVSRYLNGQPGISQVTRNRIAEAIQKLNYRAALPGKPAQIALILPSLTVTHLGYYTNELLNAFRQKLFEKKYQALIVSREDASLLRENSTLGAISFDFQQKAGHDFPNLKNIPLICLNDLGNPLENVITVCTDECFGIRRAVRHLVENHHRRIGFLSFADEPAAIATERRERAFLEETARTGAGTIPILLKTNQPVIEAVCSFLNRKCSALIVPGEGYEGPVLHSLAVLGKRIPEDLSVITYETPESCFRSPRQTTIGQDFPRIAEEALALLEKMVRGEPRPAGVEVPPRLTVRESTRDLYGSGSE